MDVVPCNITISDYAAAVGRFAAVDVVAAVTVAVVGIVVVTVNVAAVRFLL